MWLMFLPAFLALSVLSQNNEYEKIYTDTISQVLEASDPRFRPEFANQATHVSIDIHVLNMAVSTREYMLKADMYFRQKWRDPRLSFEPTHAVQLTLSPESDQIWEPDLFFSNQLNPTPKHRTKHNSLIRLDADGQALLSERLSVTVSCPMNFVNFPFDTQTCTIEIESYGTTTQEVNFEWKDANNSVRLSSPLSVPEFEVQEIVLRSSRVVMATGDYGRLSSDFVLKRSSHFYLIQAFLPALFLVVIAWLSFFMRRNSGRLVLLVCCVLSVGMLMTATNLSLPPVPYLKASDFYFYTCFLFIFGALLEYALVSCIEKHCANCMDMGATNSKWNRKLSIVDNVSAVLFLICFVLFNVAYWLHYSGV